MHQKHARHALAAIAGATLLSMSVWFSASYVLPQLEQRWSLNSIETSMLTIAVQLGFVVGALGSAVLGIADLIRGTRLIAIGASGAALCNILLLVVDTSTQAIAARAGTGLFLALVYPPALKEVSTWFRSGRGVALGVMVGALAIGSAVPHLVSAAVDLDWRIVIGATSACSVTGAVFVLTIRKSGPFGVASHQFRPREALAAITSRPVALANIGYVGHMWELYAMWAFLGTFLTQSPALSGSSHPGRAASLIAFICISSGALGCFAGGVIGDRYGHARSALISLCCSGAAAIAVASVSRGPLWMLAPVCVWWGFWIVADSAQFSALVAQYTVPAHVGSALSAQLAFGYLTTAFTIWLVPVVAERAGWPWALCLLSVGPIFGIMAMAAVSSTVSLNMSETNKGLDPV